MYKKNKGYFLTETIIVLTIVSIAITALYTTAMTGYARQKELLKNYNSVDNIYIAKELYKYVKNGNEVLEDSYRVCDEYPCNQIKNVISFDAYFLNSNKQETDNNISNLPVNVRRAIKQDSNLDGRKIFVVIFDDNSFAAIGVD